MSKILNPFQFLLVAVWTIISAVLTFLLITLTFNREMAPVVGRTIWSPVILAICGVRLKISGLENVVPGIPSIYISNHESLLDIPAIFSAIPCNLFFIAKKELKRVPFMGWAMMMGGMIFIDRKNKEQAKKDLAVAGQLIKGGKNIISFPEGTRTQTGEIGLFRRGSFVLSLNTGITVTPVAIKGARELLPSGSLQLKSGIIYLHIFPPVKPEKYTPEAADLFAGEMKQLIAFKKMQWEKN